MCTVLYRTLNIQPSITNESKEIPIYWGRLVAVEIRHHRSVEFDEVPSELRAWENPRPKKFDVRVLPDGTVERGGVIL